MTAELMLFTEPGLRRPSTRSRSPKWIPFLTFLNCALREDQRRHAQASLAKGQPLLDAAKQVPWTVFGEAHPADRALGVTAHGHGRVPAVPGLARAQTGVLQWPLTLTMSQDDAAAKLARRIDAARKAERFLVNAAEIVTLRQRGACELHRICAEFVSSVNRNLPEAALDLSPGTYAPEMFRDSCINLIQIGSQGRELQIAFEAPAQLVS